MTLITLITVIFYLFPCIFEKKYELVVCLDTMRQNEQIRQNKQGFFSEIPFKKDRGLLTLCFYLWSGGGHEELPYYLPYIVEL